jgi:hypothetical protein
MPLAIDIDQDGRDELFAGFNLVDSDGSIVWTFTTDVAKVWFGGHADSINLLTVSRDPDQTRILWTYDDAGGVAMTDGNGRLLWEATGPHYQDIGTGRLFPGEETQIAVELHHGARGNVDPMLIFDPNGVHLATLTGPKVSMLDWDGNGLDELIGGTPPAIFNGNGQPLYVLDTPGATASGVNPKFGDMNGDGLIDIIALNKDKLYIYLNQSGGSPIPNLPLGMAQNTSYNQQYWKYIQR